MARQRLTARKRTLAPRQMIPTGIHWASQPVIRAESNGMHAGYFPETLRKVLSALGFHDAPVYHGRRVPLRNHGYAWRVWVVTYEKPTEDHTRVTRETYHAKSRRATFEEGIRDAASEALARLRYDMKDELSGQQYAHFPMKASEDSEITIQQPHARDCEPLKEQVRHTSAREKAMARVLTELEEAHQRIAHYEDTIEELYQVIAEMEEGEDAGEDDDDDGDEGNDDGDDDEDEDGDEGGDAPVGGCYVTISAPKTDSLCGT